MFFATFSRLLLRLVRYDTYSHVLNADPLKKTELTRPMEMESTDGIPAMEGVSESLVALPVPGVEGVWLAYDPSQAELPPAILEDAAALVAGWLARRTVSLDPKAVRVALRHLNVPRLLGDTDLARAVLAEIPTATVRGEGLQALLVDAIMQLDPGPEAPLVERRAHLILRQLYIEEQHRLRISQELGLSERQYQRELKQAIALLTRMLAGKL